MKRPTKIDAGLIRVAVRQMASDADLCRMFALSVEQLETYRAVIDATRADAMTSLKYARLQMQARRPAGPTASNRQRAGGGE